MTPNEKQIDLLMRRYARDTNRATSGEHLDADEMNTFAEGKLSPAARAHYVSHLADCDHCRQQVAQLTLAGGAAIRPETAGAEKEHGTFWQAFAGLFALPVLRYAAFAAVLVIVGGVAFLALRQPRQKADLIAENERVKQQPASALEKAESGANQNKESIAARPSSSPQTTDGAVQNPKRDETKVAENLAPTPQPMKDAPAPFLAGKKAASSEVAPQSPSYAPPPPGETQAAAPQQPAVGGAGVFSGPRKTESLDKVSADRERDAGKEIARADDANRPAASQTVIVNRRVADEKAKGPSRNLENNQANRNASEGRGEPRTLSGADTRASTEEAPATRSAGGHKFRRQGNSWVDQKFKSSMTLKSVARGSDEFDALDSGLRSIAQQIGGEIIVVWKGKAYLLH